MAQFLACTAWRERFYQELKKKNHKSLKIGRLFINTLQLMVELEFPNLQLIMTIQAREGDDYLILLFL
jgi:hypothetical protein